MTTPDVREDDFPAPSRETTGTVGDVPTQITRLDFSDKILLTISQRGRLSQWVYATPAPLLTPWAPLPRNKSTTRQTEG